MLITLCPLLLLKIFRDLSCILFWISLHWIWNKSLFNVSLDLCEVSVSNTCYAYKMTINARIPKMIEFINISLKIIIFMYWWVIINLIIYFLIYSVYRFSTWLILLMMKSCLNILKARIWGSRQDIVNASIDYSYLWIMPYIKGDKNIRIKNIQPIKPNMCGNFMDNLEGKTFLTVANLMAIYSAEHKHSRMLKWCEMLGLTKPWVTLKVGMVIILLMNIDNSNGLCNGTKLIITKHMFLKHKCLADLALGKKVLISRMSRIHMI